MGNVVKKMKAKKKKPKKRKCLMCIWEDMERRRVDKTRWDSLS